MEDQVTEKTNDTLIISEFIDLTNPLFGSDVQSQANTLTHNGNENQSRSGNMDYNTQDLIDRMFEKDGEEELFPLIFLSIILGEFFF